MLFLNSVRLAPGVRSAVAVAVSWALLPTAEVHAADLQAPPELQTVFVSASRMPQLLKSAPIGASVISSEQIARSGVSDANEAIRRLGGVAGKTDLAGGREYTLDLRGYGDTASANTVVMVDGIRVSENELIAARLSSIPVDAIDRIEIVRGGNSVMWGEGATGGVINVILKRQASVGTSAKLQGAVTSFRGKEVQVSAAHQSGIFSVDGSAQSIRSDGYRDRNRFEQDVRGFGLQWTTEAWSQRLRVQQESQFAQLPGALTFAQWRANPRQASKPSDFGETDETRLSSNTEFKFKAWTAQLDLSSRSRDTDSTYSGNTYETSVLSQQATPKLSHEAKWSGLTTNTIVGFDLQRWTLDAHNPFADDHGWQSNKAFFAHSDWAFDSLTRLAFGWRAERVNKKERSVSGAYDRRDSLKAAELGVSQELAKDWTVYGRWAQSYRLPNFDENGNTPGGQPLRPQRGRDKELGLRWSAGANAFSVRYFRQDNVDEITYVPFTFFNENVDPTRRQGVEMEGRWSMSSALEWRLNWQSLSAKYRAGPNAGKEQVLVAPQTATLRLAYRINERQTLDTGVQYLGAMRFNDDGANQCARKIPESALMDARYAWSDKTWTVALSGTNLADQHSFNYAYSCATGSLYPEPGRAFKLTLARQF
ncbi:TonB-dependent receptor [Aquabacterium sp. CECT 9606]|uniref:TonB-dependent receptor n=1 Tax=Aquabacterium sp. CECT 9606 TaxID=2845822 RepID=UPI001E6159A8|nr:TonB-dependent receptor [Aquabacterium sp. CECT 9606]CAH0354622.1 Vitamin B12 transporter BtuB [Aquabacterium sp. CECT 9606]